MDKKEYSKQYYAANVERRRAYQREYNAKNRDKVSARHREYRAKNRDKISAYRREYNAKNHDKLRVKRREYKAKTRDKSRAHNLWVNYGLSVDDYKKLLAQQNGLCAICGWPGDRLFVDHDHTTGKIRGLVHNTCNSGIGLLGDSAEIVEKAATYLRKTQPQPFAAEKYREDYGF